jgi:purine-binding chemotaxis protein CheW
MAVGEMLTTDLRELCLLVRVGSQLCAIPVSRVEETMRSQPIRAIAGVPAGVCGLSLIRGLPVPVVSVARVLGQNPSVVDPARLVTVRTAGRHVALGVDEVLGVARIAARQLSALPPLLDRARAELSTLGTLDEELLIVLDTSRLVSDELWATLDGGGAR